VLVSSTEGLTNGSSINGIFRGLPRFFSGDSVSLPGRSTEAVIVFVLFAGAAASAPFGMGFCTVDVIGDVPLGVSFTLTFFGRPGFRLMGSDAGVDSPMRDGFLGLIVRLLMGPDWGSGRGFFLGRPLLRLGGSGIAIGASRLKWTQGGTMDVAVEAR
jgi:hypothetical protein